MFNETNVNDSRHQSKVSEYLECQKELARRLVSIHGRSLTQHVRYFVTRQDAKCSRAVDVNSIGRSTEAFV